MNYRMVVLKAGAGLYFRGKADGSWRSCVRNQMDASWQARSDFLLILC